MTPIGIRPPHPWLCPPKVLASLSDKLSLSGGRMTPGSARLMHQPFSNGNRETASPNSSSQRPAWPMCPSLIWLRCPEEWNIRIGQVKVTCSSLDSEVRLASTESTWLWVGEGWFPPGKSEYRSPKCGGLLGNNNRLPHILASWFS